MTNNNQVKNTDSDIHNPIEIPLRIMVVDDFPEMRWSILELLKGEGHEVTEASGTKDAFDKVASDNQFDLIISDYNLPPGQNGIELNRLITKAGFHIPFILFSGDISGIPEAEINSVHLYALLEKSNGFTLLLSYIQDIQEKKFEKLNLILG